MNLSHPSRPSRRLLGGAALLARAFSPAANERSDKAPNASSTRITTCRRLRT